ncbi:MAG: hypothetical protein AAF483_26565 [Planctomycetota bacterium]
MVEPTTRSDDPYADLPKRLLNIAAGYDPSDNQSILTCMRMTFHELDKLVHNEEDDHASAVFRKAYAALQRHALRIDQTLDDAFGVKRPKSEVKERELQWGNTIIDEVLWLHLQDGKKIDPTACREVGELLGLTTDQVKNTFYSRDLADYRRLSKQSIQRALRIKS